MADPALLAEAYKRGLLPADKAAAYEEAMRRGIISKPASGGLLGEIGGVVSGAVNKLKADVTDDYQQTIREAKQPPANMFAGLGRTGRTVADVANVVASPIAGLIHGAVVKPIASAMDQIPMDAYAPPSVTLQGGKVGLTPARKLNSQETHAANEQSVNNALMGARPGAAPVAAPVAAAKSNPFASMAQRFDAAGVTPLPVAAGGKGAATLTNVVAENPFAGGAVRARLRNAVSQTADSATNLAGRYGDARGAQITGENVQSGVQRFASEKAAPTSFAAKSGAAYDDVFSKLDSAMGGKTAPGRPVAVADDQFPAQTVIGGSQIATPATTSALSGIRGGTQSASVADLIADPTLSKAARALESANGAKDMSFGDLRRLRTWVRDAKANPELRQNIGAANLGRLESSLTQDIYANAEKLGSPQLANQLRRTDQMYAAGMNRIQTALQPFADARSGESAYSRITQAAGSTSSADAQKLLSLKRSLAPDEWGDVAANVVNELGKQTAGTAAAGENGFSVGGFVTNYNKLSPRGRDVLFGSLGGGGQRASSLRAALDNLASVADDLKRVEKGANTSKSFVNAQAAGTIGALTIPGAREAMITGLGSMALTGEAMTNPVVVRWLSRVGTAARANPQAVHVVVKQLGSAARTNAALTPLYQESKKLLAPPQHLLARSAAEEPQQQPAP